MQPASKGATNGDGGARQVESGRCHVSASNGYQVPVPTEVLGAHSALVAQDIRLPALHVRGVWWCRLDTMADDVGGCSSHVVSSFAFVPPAPISHWRNGRAKVIGYRRRRGEGSPASSSRWMRAALPPYAPPAQRGNER